MATDRLVDGVNAACKRCNAWRETYCVCVCVCMESVYEREGKGMQA